MKKEIDNNQQYQEVSPFMKGVIKWFQNLMDKYTRGKYSSEEAGFFFFFSPIYDDIV